MPMVPELALTCEDLVSFDKMLGRRHNEEITDEYLEAYKYVFSKPGLYTHTHFGHNTECSFNIQHLWDVCFHFLGAFTGGIDYYRGNFSSGQTDDGDQSSRKIDGSNGMFVLGEGDKYISRKSLKLASKIYPKMRIETVAKANHFLQHHSAEATNNLIRDFLGPASDFTIQTFK